MSFKCCLGKLFYKIVTEVMIRDYARRSHVCYLQFAKKLISENVLFTNLGMFVVFVSF